MPGGTIAERIRSRRKGARLSLDQLAAKAGVSKTYLWELEADGAGVKRPSADVLQRIAGALGTTLSDLVGQALDGRRELPQEFAALALSWRAMIHRRDLLLADLHHHRMLALGESAEVAADKIAVGHDMELDEVRRIVGLRPAPAPAGGPMMAEHTPGPMRTTEELIRNGWQVEKVSQYDEEGVEGWRWTSPEGREFDVIGSWDELPPRLAGGPMMAEYTPGPWFVSPKCPTDSGG